MLGVVAAEFQRAAEELLGPLRLAVEMEIDAHQEDQVAIIRLVERGLGQLVEMGPLQGGVVAVKLINNDGALATLDVLGEDITTREEAIASREECKRVISTITENALKSNLSIKLTQL